MVQFLLLKKVKKRKRYLINEHRLIFYICIKETNQWTNHLMSYLERITDYRYHKLNEILEKEN